jgi:D-3-phosphoglycerate dehydrogenase
MKVYMVDRYNSAEFRVLDIFKNNGIEFIIENCKTEQEVIDQCADADALLVVYFPITKRIISHLDHCKVIMRYGIGYENVDVEAATEKGIAVCNLPDYCIPEVATHAMALILDAVRKTRRLHNELHKGIWSKDLGADVHRLSELTLGLLGFGNIARTLAQYAKPFGISLIAYDPYIPENVFAQLGVKKVELDELFATSDIISIHVPLTPQTRHLINKANIAKMKDQVIIINTSRGPIICEADLVDALQAGKIKAAGLDVFEAEPIKDKNHPLLQFDNVTVTPHVSYGSVESREDMLQKASKTIVTVLSGEIPYNAVNKKTLIDRTAN